MRVVPEGTSHVWTPAVEVPFVGLLFRRAYYSLVDGEWFALSYSGTWSPTRNDANWFEKEIASGYFVPVDIYTDPTFVPVKEIP